MNFQTINTDTPEGKLLLMAIASLTTSPEIRLNGETVDGRKMTPDEVITQLGAVAKEVYEGYEPMPTGTRDYTTDKVAEMMALYGQEVRTAPQEISDEEKKLSINLIFEEVKELAFAMGMNQHFAELCINTYSSIPTDAPNNVPSDLVEVLDGLSDIRVVVDGTANRYGMGGIFKAAFDEVQSSNMSKSFDNSDDANTFAIATSEDAYVCEIDEGCYVVKKASDKKVIKPPHYKPANLKQFIDG